MAGPRIGDASISVSADASGFQQSLAKQTGKAAADSGTKFSQFMGKTLKAGAVATGAGIATVLGASFVAGFSRLNAIDQATHKLTGLGHSAGEVKVIMGNALTSVKGTAYGLGEAASQAASLVASGIKPGKDLTRTLSLLADTATISGASFGEVGQIFGKVSASGRLTTEALNQLQDRGVPVLKFLADTTGKSMSQVATDITKGKISFATFQKAMEKGLGGAAKSSGDTFQGALANVTAALGRFGAGVLGGVFSKMPGLFKNAIDWIDKITPAAERVGKAVSGFITDKVIPAFENMGTAVVNVVTFFVEHENAAKALGVIVGGVVATVIGAWVAQGVAATISAAKSVAAWFATATAGTTTATLHSKSTAQIVVGWVVASAAAVKSGAETVAVWALYQVEAIKGAAVSVAAHVRVAAGWVASAAGAVASAAVHVGAWILMGAQALLGAAKIALAWLIAMGPIALVIAAIIGLVVIVVLNFDKIKNWISGAWDWVKAKTLAIWASILSWLSGVWDAIKNKAVAIFDSIKNWLSGVWDSIKAKTLAVWNSITGWLSGVWASLAAGVSRTFNAVKDAISRAWDKVTSLLYAGWAWIRDRVFAPIGTALTKLGTAFEKAKDFIGTVWGKLKELAAVPIRFIIGTVINKGLIHGFNWLSDKIGGPHINDVAVGFASGGVMPGYTPGRDVHRFTSPTGGSLNLSGGEAVMVPEWTRAVGGAPAVAGMNAAARSGHSFAGGGIIDWIKSKAAGTFDWVKDKAGGIWQGLTHPMDYIKGLLPSLPGGSYLADAAPHVVAKAGEAIKAKISSLFSIFNTGFNVTEAERRAATGPSGFGPQFAGIGVGNVMPVNGPITAEFGRYPSGGEHRGVDFGVGAGTLVHAFRSGLVNYAGWDNTGFGNLVRISHGGGIMSLYGHNRSFLTKTGAHVAAGAGVALSDSTGNSTGNHVHFEIKLNGRSVNPWPYLAGRGSGSSSGSWAKGGILDPFLADSGVMLGRGLNLLDNRTGGPEPLHRADQGGPSIVIHNLTISVDDLRRMSDVADFIDMLQGARVQTRRTARSGMVSA